MLHFSTFLNGFKNKSHRVEVISTNDMKHQLGTKRFPTHFSSQFSKTAARMLSGSRHVTSLPFLWIKLKIHLECPSSPKRLGLCKLLSTDPEYLLIYA